MAFYPEPPGTRIAYDLDGSQALIRASVEREWLDVHPVALRALNSERGGGLIPVPGPGFPLSDIALDRTLVLLFPRPMRIRGVYAQYDANTALNEISWLYVNTPRYRPEVSFSTDSTNGDDGAFTTVIEAATEATETLYATASATNALTGESYGGGFVANDHHRKIAAVMGDPLGIVPVAGQATRNVRAIRLTLRMLPASGGPVAVGPAMKLHVYGEPDTSAVGSRLDFWQSDLDQRISATDLDWGDVPLTSTGNRSVRVRNRSIDQTAVNIRISATPGASSASPAPDGFFLLSLDGVTWEPFLMLDALAPETTSPEIFIRLTVPSTALLSNWAPRITAEAEEWI